MADDTYEADAIIVGAGLAGLAAADLADEGHEVLIVDQESESSLGGQVKPFLTRSRADPFGTVQGFMDAVPDSVLADTA